MKYVQITEDVWVNLSETESIVRTSDGLALIQGRQRVYESTIPFEAVIVGAKDTREDNGKQPVRHVTSPLLVDKSQDPFNTSPAW